MGKKKKQKYWNTRILHSLFTSLRHRGVGCAFNKEMITRQTNTAQLKYQEPKPVNPWVCWEGQRTQSPASGEVLCQKNSSVPRAAPQTAPLLQLSCTTSLGCKCWESRAASANRAPAPSAEQNIQAPLPVSLQLPLPTTEAWVSFWRARQEEKVLSHKLLRLDV